MSTMSLISSMLKMMVKGGADRAVPDVELPIQLIAAQRRRDVEQLPRRQGVVREQAIEDRHSAAERDAVISIAVRNTSDNDLDEGNGDGERDAHEDGDHEVGHRALHFCGVGQGGACVTVIA